MGYLPYYLTWFLVMRVVDHPMVAVGLLLLFAVQRYLPDPWVWMRTIGTVRRLGQQVDANPANVTARRDLARIFVERGLPRKALGLLEEARKRAPKQADLWLLTGMAHLRAGHAEAALEPLREAIECDARVGFGEPYRVAGEAFRKLGQYEQAENAFEHYLDVNSSSVEAWFRIYQARAALGRKDDARAALHELFSTWRQLPDVHRRRHLWWWLRALPAKLVA